MKIANMSSDLSVQKSILYLTQVETLAQEILTLKQEKLELSNARNKYREAFRALENTHDKYTMLEVGRIYMELPRSTCITLLKKDIEKSTEDIDRLYTEIKGKVEKLRDLEHQPKIEGFSLKPMTGVEARAINRGFGLEK